MKIKLPRKRKKAYIKRWSNYDYNMCIIANYTLMDALGIRNDSTKFVKKIINVREKIFQYW